MSSSSDESGIQSLYPDGDPSHHQNSNICSLGHCQPSAKISCKSVRKFLRKVANRQTDKRQTSNDDSSLANNHYHCRKWPQSLLIRKYRYVIGIISARKKWRRLITSLGCSCCCRCAVNWRRAETRYPISRACNYSRRLRIPLFHARFLSIHPTASDVIYIHRLPSLLDVCTLRACTRPKRRHYIHQGGYVIVVARLSVCLSVSKNFGMGLHEIFRECWQWANKQWLNFGGDPGKTCLGGGMHCPSAFTSE